MSNGRYAEFKNVKRIETIGSVRFNTERKKIVGFGENKRSVEVVSRFLSVDPLARQYPWFSPYQFAGNMPIAAIDLDGLEIFFSTTPIVFSSAAATTTTATTVARMGIRATDLATSSGSGSTASPIVRPALGQILPPPLPPVIPEAGVNQPGSTAGQKSQEQVTNELFENLIKRGTAKPDATQVTRNTPLAQQKEKESNNDNTYFRGTTMGFGDHLPSDAYTSTSTDPLIATLFGLAAEGKRHEAGVLHISFESDVMGLGRDQNWLAGKESEVAFMVHPLSFEKNNTSFTISVDKARGILQGMGFSLPSSKSLANPSRLDQEISEQPKMSKYQIEEFVNRARQ